METTQTTEDLIEEALSHAQNARKVLVRNKVGNNVLRMRAITAFDEAITRLTDLRPRR